MSFRGSLFIHRRHAISLPTRSHNRGGGIFELLMVPWYTLYYWFYYYRTLLSNTLSIRCHEFIVFLFHLFIYLIQLNHPKILIFLHPTFLSHPCTSHHTTAQSTHLTLMCYLHRVKPTVVTVPEARCHSINQCEMDPKRYPQPVNHSPILPGECREDEFAIDLQWLLEDNSQISGSFKSIK